MPLLLALAAALGAGAFLVDRATKLGQSSGVLAPDSQTNVPEAQGTIGRNADKLGTSASIGLLVVSSAFAYSLVKQ
jgi:hypothetical protein